MSPIKVFSLQKELALFSDHDHFRLRDEDEMDGEEEGPNGPPQASKIRGVQKFSGCEETIGVHKCPAFSALEFSRLSSLCTLIKLSGGTVGVSLH